MTLTAPATTWNGNQFHMGDERGSLAEVPPAITTTGLAVHYGDKLALAGVDLVVPAGSSLAVIGPNGSGKSTLLGAIAGTIPASAGVADVAGSIPALVMQSTDVDQSLPISVRDTVALARYPSVGLLRRFQTKDNDVINRALARMAIEDLVGHQIHELSGGQRQRVLVAQGLAQGSDVLLLDEPVTGLDVASRAMILDVLQEEVASGCVVVMTTHSLDDAQRCDQVLLLDTYPIALGTPSEVLTEQYLHQAFGGHSIRIGDNLILDDPHHSH